MKKLILLLLFVCATMLMAEEPKGTRVKVELVSGAVQFAQFLGIQKDTVSLGGNIQGKFTIVRIAKDRFKSIVDEQGNNLLTAADSAVAESTSIDSTVTDTTAMDSTAIDTSAAAPANETIAEPTFLDSVSGKHIFVALERRSIDSTLEEQIRPIIIRLLKESGTPLTIAKRSDFGYCRESSCTRDSLAKYGASSVYQGSISAGASQDSLILQMTHWDLLDSNSQELSAKISLSVFNSLSSALTNNKLNNFISLLQGDSIIEPATGTAIDSAKKNGPSYIKMESDPEGATITIPGKNDVCKTPCTFALQDTSKIDVYAYWNVDNQLWGNKRTIKPIPNDTTKISIRLKKVKPELNVYTIPEGAYIYAGSNPITHSTSPIGKSPNKFSIYEPGESFVQIRKAGYRDTLVSFFASPTELTNLSVTLHPISNPAELEQQNEWIRQQRKSFIGKVLMGSSIAPFIAGAITAYLASQKYDDAKEIKDELEKSPSFNGPNYQEKVRENKDLVKKGDRQMIIGGSLIGLGAAMLGVGFLLTF